MIYFYIFGSLIQGGTRRNGDVVTNDVEKKRLIRK
jgi:hypothetical protein